MTDMVYLIVRTFNAASITCSVICLGEAPYQGPRVAKPQLLAIDLVLLPVGADSISLTGHVYVG